MVEVKWTLQSIEDIERIADYIAKDSLHYADLQVLRFFESAEVLEQFPKIGRIVPELKNKNLREIIIGPYRLIYLLKSPTKIDVLTVHHSKKRLAPQRLRKELKK